MLGTSLVFCRDVQISFQVQLLSICKLFIEVILNGTRGVSGIKPSRSRGTQPWAHFQVVITHASHVCSQYSFGLPLIISLRASSPIRVSEASMECIERISITRVWTFYHS